MRTWVLALLVLTACLGCSQRTLIRSHPADAVVYVDGFPVGRTPVTISVPREKFRDRIPLRLEHEGYEPAELELRSIVRVGRILGAIFWSGGLAIPIQGVRGFARVPPILMTPLPAGSPASPENRELDARLERIDRMRADGTITEAEARELRKNILMRSVQ
jgi:hypothetical protein